MTTINAPARTCGTCSLCCKAMWIAELNKPAGPWCEHARPGRPGGACSIYETRFPICRSFQCEWLLNEQIPEELKPNKSKVILTTVAGTRETQLVAYVDTDDPTAWRREPAYKFLKAQTASPNGVGRSIVIWVGKHMWLMTPRGEHDLGMAKGRRSFSIEQDAQGREVVKLIETPEPAPGSHVFRKS